MIKRSRRSVVKGIGHGVPAKILTNFDLEKIVETSDEWITQRTGIRERRMAEENEASSTFAIAATHEALQRSGVDARDLDLVVCATVTPDYLFPSTSCLVQSAVGARNAGAFDLGAACAGFIYALSTASSMIEAGVIETAAVVGVDTLTKFINWKDRSTCVLFGDGAGCVILHGEANTDRGLEKTVLMADGSGAENIIMYAGGSLHPVCRPSTANVGNQIEMSGSEVYRFAIGAMGDACCKVLEEANYAVEDIDLFVPHQANLRIIESAAKRLGLPPEKVFVNVDKYGNTSGGSIPLALYEAEVEGRLKPGMLVMTVGFGAGLVWGANLIRW